MSLGSCKKIKTSYAPLLTPTVTSKSVTGIRSLKEQEQTMKYTLLEGGKWSFANLNHSEPEEHVQKLLFTGNKRGCTMYYLRLSLLI